MIILLLPAEILAAQIKLRWDKNKESNVVGYKVYSRQAHEDYDYHNPIWSGSENQCVLPGLKDKTNYYFVVRAITLTGEESGDSVETEYDYERDYEMGTDAVIGIDYDKSGYTSMLGGAVLGGASGGADSGSSCFIRSLQGE